MEVKMRKGFTLIELIVVVIIVAIMATFAIPQYLSATERAKSGKARNAMGLIAQAEKLYRADKDLYLAVNSSTTDNAAFVPSSGTSLNDYVELSGIVKDTDWVYVVTSTDLTENFLITATRQSGPANTRGTITLKQDGEWCGDRAVKVGGQGGVCS
jgi:prepilin-type N-terminal cleavage/methylation domain-containing protein